MVLILGFLTCYVVVFILCGSFGTIRVLVLMLQLNPESCKDKESCFNIVCTQDPTGTIVTTAMIRPNWNSNQPTSTEPPTAHTRALHGMIHYLLFYQDD